MKNIISMGILCGKGENSINFILVLKSNNLAKSQRKFQSDLPIKRQILQGKIAFLFFQSQLIKGSKGI